MNFEQRLKLLEAVQLENLDPISAASLAIDIQLVIDGAKYQFNLMKSRETVLINALIAASERLEKIDAGKKGPIAMDMCAREGLAEILEIIKGLK